MAQLLTSARLGAQAVGKWLSSNGSSVYAGGTALQAVDQWQAGRSANAQLRQQAQAVRGASSRQAEIEHKKALLTRSRALAVAAASGGGGVQDPTVNNLLADIETQGLMNSLNAVYEGEEEARGLEFEGRMRKRAGKAAAVSTILSGVGSLAQKYG